MSEPQAVYQVGTSPPQADGIYKVYLKRYNSMGKSEVDKATSTTTPYLAAALAAFVEQRRNKALDHTETHLVMSRDNKHLLYHRFDVEPGHQDFVPDNIDVSLTFRNGGFSNEMLDVISAVCFGVGDAG